MQTVSVIVPTAAEPSRRASLLRAIDTITGQVGVRAVPIIVANGTSCDRELMATLSRRSDVRLLYREEAGLPQALHAGRRLVDTPLYAELDDDDELLPNGLAMRLDAMVDGSIDVVVTNGLVRNGTMQAIAIDNMAAIAAAPLMSLMSIAWLRPGSAMFRTQSVGREYFEEIPSYLEWTCLALRLALTRNIRFLDEPTFIYNAATRSSLSKSREYILRQPQAIRAMMAAAGIPREIRSALRCKHVAALHHASDCERLAGRFASAWRLHVASILHPRGWKYVSYTRHLLAALGPWPTRGCNRGGAVRD